MFDENFYTKPSVKKKTGNSDLRARDASDDPENLSAELQPPSGIIVKKSDLGGYGVFAEKSFRVGEVLEEAPFVRTDFRSKDLVHNQLRQSCFTLPCSCEECKHRGRFFVLAAGFAQIYNHSKDPDVKCEFNRKQRLIQIIAVKNIAAGKEILTDYGESYDHFGPIEL